MNYKMILPLLLCVSVTQGTTNKQNLEDQLFKKQLELSELREMIVKRIDITRNVFKQASEHMQDQNEAKGNSMVTVDETKNEFVALGERLDAFLERFYEAKENNVIKGFLAKELYGYDEKWNNSFFDFDSPKFLWLSCKFEYALLRTLVEKYETCLQELCALEKQCNNFNARK